MKIFISWSGERSEALAKALREWLPLVLHFVDPWLSQSDIKAGERWSIEIARELEKCNFGIICITKENISSPWILFEAGALAKSMEEGRVIPLLLDLDFKEISGPLAQFQAKKAELSGIKELVLNLNQASSNKIQDSNLDRLFRSLWGDFEESISSIPKPHTPSKPSRPQSEILEELVSSVRSVEVRIRETVDDEFLARRRRRLRPHPSIIYDLMNQRAGDFTDPVNLLIVASFFKDDAPWLYDLAVDSYREIKSGRKVGSVKSLEIFTKHAAQLIDSPFFEETGMDKGALKLIRSHFIDMIQYVKYIHNDMNISSEFSNIKRPPQPR